MAHTPDPTRPLPPVEDAMVATRHRRGVALLVSATVLLTLAARVPRALRGDWSRRPRRRQAARPVVRPTVPADDAAVPAAAARSPHGWMLLAAAFSALVLLMIVSGLAAQRKSHEFYARVGHMNEAYRASRRTLEQVRSGIHVSSVVLRDYLLDPSTAQAPLYRAELVAQRDVTAEQLARLGQLTGQLGSDAASTIAELRIEIDAYWDSLQPVFDWSDEEKRSRATGFLRREVIPRRDAVLDLSREIAAFHDGTLVAQQAELYQTERDYSRFLGRTTFVTAALGTLIALVSIARVTVLERRSEQQKQRAEDAERQLRQLSTDLVHAHEEERRTLSRELHDEVGQMLTGLRMQVKALRRLRGSPPATFDAQLAELRHSLESAVQAVRDIAMGLRPSMLDDLGLGSALEWQAREFSRRHDIPVTLDLRAGVDALPDLPRTAIYRIVQEALTNCARHARARGITIVLDPAGSDLRLVVADDGVGFDVGAASRGVGLLGMRERVRELHGRLTLHSTPGGGTRVEVLLPDVLRRSAASAASCAGDHPVEVPAAT